MASAFRPPEAKEAQERPSSTAAVKMQSLLSASDPLQPFVVSFMTGNDGLKMLPILFFCSF